MQRQYTSGGPQGGARRRDDAPWPAGATAGNGGGAGGRERRIAIAARVSTADQERDGTSLDDQVQRGRALAQMLGAEVVEACIYQGDESGTLPLEHRPILQGMLADARAGRFTAIVFHKIDRIARRLRYMLEIWDMFEDAGVTVYVIEPMIDSSDAFGRAIRNIIGTLAELEAALILERTMTGRRANYDREGKNEPWITNTKYGYSYTARDKARGKRGRIATDEEQARVIRRIYTERARGASVERIAVGLTADGIANPSGEARWVASTVARILADPAYKGSGRWGLRASYRQANGKRGHRKRSDSGGLVEVEYPRIVSDDVWAAANSGRKGCAVRAEPGKYLLGGGLLTCAEHDHTMTGSDNGKGTPRYACVRCRADGGRTAHTVAARPLEDAVWAAVMAFMLEPERALRAARGLAAGAEEEMERVALRRAEVARDLAEVERQAAHVLGHAALVDASVETMRLALEPLNRRRAELRDELERLPARAQVARGTLAQAVEVGDILADFAAYAQTEDRAERRALLDDLGVRVALRGAEYEITGVVPEMTRRGMVGVQAPLTWSCELALHPRAFLIRGRVAA